MDQNTRTTAVLTLKPQWLQLVLHGGKRMEVRGTPTRKIGATIYLMASRTQHIVGTATITGCVGPMTEEDWTSSRDLHKCDTNTLPYKKTYGWMLDNVRVLAQPIPHVRKRGAIVFSTHYHDV